MTGLEMSFTHKATWSLLFIANIFTPMAGLAASPVSSVIVQTETADLLSTFSQQAASTTTVTKPFQYKLKHPDGLTLLYNGCRGSRMEPCGCRALNLGGIDKEAAMVQSIRAANPNTLYLEAGGFFREFAGPSMRLQTWHIMDALSALNCQAINIGFPDLAQGMATLKLLESKFDLPFISANIVDAGTGLPVFGSHKSLNVALAGGGTTKVAVVGVTAKTRDTSRDPATQAAPVSAGSSQVGPVSPSRWMIAETNGKVPWLPFDVHSENDGAGGAAPIAGPGGSMPEAVQFAVDDADGLTSTTFAPYRVNEPLPAAQELGKRLSADHDYLVLLAYTSVEAAVEMAKFLPEYDLIIAADYIGRVEPVKPTPEGPLVIGGDHDGKYLGIVEVPPGSGKNRALPPDVDMLPILQSIEPLPEYTQFIRNFSEDTAALPVEKTAGELSEKIYAGVSSCKTCHGSAHDQWKSHKHSIAMKTLVEKNMHFNPDCLKCHTVAYKMPGGFTDLRVTANLANVQCEVCHGPADAHVKEMRAAEVLKREGKPVPPMTQDLRMTWDANFCMQCHDPQNDPHFNFNEDIHRVRHKNPAPQRERPTTVSLEMM